MTPTGTPQSEFSELIEQRFTLVRSLAESLELSTMALARNNAEGIARGAAHQAELCRHWSELETELSAARLRNLSPASDRASESCPESSADSSPRSLHSSAAAQLSGQWEAEWETLAARIRFLTRVHWSLLRHLERSLAVLHRVVDTCANTYTPETGLVASMLRPWAGE